VTITTNESIQTQFRTIDGLSIRFAESEERSDHARLLSPWPAHESNGASKTPASRRAFDFRLRVAAHPALAGRALHLARSSGPRMLRAPSSLDVKGL
jgi:hypothetical protein